MSDLDLNVPHGYRLNPGTDLLDLAARLRETMEPIRDRIEIDEVAEFAAKFLDAADLAGTPRPEAVIFDAVQAQTVHVGQILSGEHGCAPITMSMTVSDDPETGEMYALMFLSHEAYGAAMDELEIGTYYPYWNEDAAEERRPVGVSAAEWVRRAAVWGRVLRGTDPHDPYSMFQIKVGSPLPGMDLITHAAEVFAAMPSIEGRISHALHSLQGSQEFATPSEVMAFVAAIPEHQERIQASLKPITLEDIAGSAT